ncbi:valine--tRNA ligase, mitochondrial [Spea bombifrons]|uniref:valine--tRNA ligase, mitochondrial n=1 Tax=Spea bombifrons TaxID=233779 RepID=UPI0023494F26|nr:valine--tRNA ligase, mitochondrial [Spea bombifrons]XP_053329182.1 valine--tRNA ligase, mitochondrial [Spea bombifrons]XP_053329183.1 valine--tRNA ligase, mitochondrial [Spea bombifrons]
MIRLVTGTNRNGFQIYPRRGASSLRDRIRREERKQRQQNLQEERAAQVISTKGQHWKEKEVIKYEKHTEPGDKKDTSAPLPPSYSPGYVEAAWYSWWVKQGFFKPEVQKIQPHATQETFALCIPPPNVTGSLHLGHALTVAIEDSLVRWRRMKGQKVLWVPGSDHAGIATQAVVEKKLWKEQSLSRHDLGREKFLESVWEWKEEKGDRIYHQLKSLGASLDWERSCFTMDETFSRAVTEAFVQLYDDGLVSRRRRLVNWSCTLRSAISDIEVESRPLTGKTNLFVPGYQRKVPFGLLFSFAYPTEEGGDEITVATTRPETMLGDTAVAVHPDDLRYLRFHGKRLRHPFSGRLIPVVTHELVNPEFGTGAVKVTPAHSLVDFEMAQALSLPMVSVIGEDGAMTEAAGDWIQGVKRFDAREQVLSALKEKGLYRGDCEHALLLPICSRSGDVIEHLLKSQWFVNCDDMAQKALEAVDSGRLKMTPSYHQKNWRNWLSNISDWCVSRQLWWGHQIPAYSVTVQGTRPEQNLCGETEGFWVAARSEAEARRKAAETLGRPEEELLLKRDEDVLDTWFSSALFPFAMLGWPEHTQDFQAFYPNSLLETGSDLLFFWVARMVMLGEQLTGRLPFREVLLHSMVRDAHGRKMSKSLGNVLDPLDVMTGISLEGLQQKLKDGNLDPRELKVAEAGLLKDYPRGIPECGTDALRFALCSYRVQGDDINLDVASVLAVRHFCNKIWNGVKFVLSALGEDFAPVPMEELRPCAPVDRWLLDRLRQLTEECERRLQTYDIHVAAGAIQAFWVQIYCDVYLEAVKPVLKGPHASDARQVLYRGAELTLRLLSPFTPFLSEELWQRLPSADVIRAPSVCVAEYPSPLHTAHWLYPEEVRQFDFVQSVIRTLRNLRSEYNMTKARPEVHVFCSLQEDLQSLQAFLAPLQTLSLSGPLHLHLSQGELQHGDPPGWAIGEVTENCHVHLNLQGLVDPPSDLIKLKSKHQKLKRELQEKMRNKTEDTEDKSLQQKISRIQRTIETLQRMIGDGNTLQP